MKECLYFFNIMLKNKPILMCSEVAIWECSHFKNKTKKKIFFLNQVVSSVRSSLVVITRENNL